MAGIMEILNMMWQKSVRVVLALALAFTMTPFVAPEKAHAETGADGKWHIATPADLFYYTSLSRSPGYQDKDIVLDADLDLTGIATNDITNGQGFIFGTIDLPYSGTFDGQNHTITGLSYDRDLWTPKANTGLFAYTKNAVIKNLTLKDAKVGADFRGGVLVSLAESTRIENVTLINCTSSVTPANNAVSLITNAGVIGGVLAGTVRDCTLYNCEVQGGYAVQNSTSGVAALGGQYLYMGGLVGAADSSTIEYCRVTPYRGEDASGNPTVEHTHVKNKYDNAVGALGGFTVYAGGLAGIAQNNTKIIDCFSTADTYAYCGTYVSVGAGATAHVGGIAAYASNSKVTRSHYAGNLHSYQYNALLVIPIIETDVNLAGIVESTGDDVTVTDSYFKRSASVTTKGIDSVGSSASGASHGPESDEVYVDRFFWEGHDYDFAGGTVRSSNYSPAHINKWIMDYRLGIPVHGSSIKATFDFPGAGSVTIGTTALSPQQPQTTDDPWTFAVQGFLAADNKIEIKTDSVSGGPGGVGQNLGYAFRGWYRVPDITVNEVAEDPEYFKAKLQGATLVAEGDACTLNNKESGGIRFANNDLFVAHYQANVLFHDVKGGVVDKETGKTETAPNTEDDWYSYCDALPSVVPEVRPESETATFIGWTTVPDETVNSDGSVTPGYEAIMSSELIDIKNNGAFYAAGDPIEKPMDLYPVYSDYSSNILTEIEGYDSESNKTVRASVGSTYATKVDNPDGTISYQVHLRDSNDVNLSSGGSLPDGYRFLGWYEKKTDSLEVRVSTDPSYTIPSDADLTQQHTYIARFEYRVDYWVKAFNQSAGSSYPVYKEGALYASRWYRYQGEFVSLLAPKFVYQDFRHWGLDVYQNQTAFDGRIAAPIKVYSCYGGSSTTWYIEMLMDFPGSATITDSNAVLKMEITAEPHEDFKFIGYTFESYYSLTQTSQESGSDKVFIKGTTDTTLNYTYVARLTADVKFYDKGSEDEAKPKTVVTRRYEERVLLDEDAPYTYKYVTKDKGDSGLSTTSQKAPDAPAYDGYCFLGWVDKSAIAAGEMTVGEWNYIFDVEGEKSCTSQASKAIPYLVSEDAVCTRPMELYPVYVKYDVSTTTNIKRAGVPSGVNVPTAPKINDGTNGTLTLPYLAYGVSATAQSINVDANGNIDSLILTIDANTKVVNEQEELYRLTSITVEKDGVPVATIPAVEGQDQYTYNGGISPGPSYTFVANYEPLVAVYHVNDSEVKTVVRNNGDPLGKGPDPTFDISEIDALAGGSSLHVFVGWTAAKPESRNYVIWSETTSMVSSKTIVRQSMELWPVYRASTVSVNSNIDDIIKAPAKPEDYRSLQRLGAIDSVTLVAEAKDYPGYEFDHWATNYADGNGGTKITDANNFILRGDLPFAGTVYTAVYVPVHEVRYHDTSGEVIYTANVVGDERTFVTSAVEDPDSGGASGEEVEVPIDAEAYQIIAEKLNGIAGPDGRETFSNWQWAKSKNEIVAWGDFKGVKITQDMDLYPITWKVSATDASAPDPQPITDQLTWAIDVNALEAKELGQGGGTTEPDPAAQVERVKQDYPIQAYFGQGNYYDQAFLTVHVEKVSYKPAAEGQGTAMKIDATAALGKKIALYDDVVTGNIVRSYIGDQLELQDFQEVSAANTLVCTVDGVEYRTGANPGDALFVFGEVQPLVVTKKTSSPHAAGEVFLFTVTSINEDGTKDTRTVSIQCSEKPENGYYVGSAQFQLKPGTYYVKENGSWAWRYDQTYAVNGMPVDFGGDGARVVVSRSQSGSSVVCENMQQSDSWLDGSARAINTFGTGAVNNG